MRTKAAALVSALLILGLVIPSASLARRENVIGSLAITKAGGVALSTELVGLAIFATPGWEKLISQQIPPFTLPVVLDSEREDDDEDHAASHRGRRFHVHTDTILLLTNTTGSVLSLELTVRDLTGVVLLLDKLPVALDPHETRVALLSQMLP